MGKGHQPSVAVTLAVLAVALTSCAPAGMTPGPAAGESRPDQDRPLVMIARGEPDTLAAKEVLRVTGLSFSTVPRLFNAGLTTLDAQEVARPYLAEQLPQINTESWRVTPDGRMETIYRLRPNLVWHDGTPLHAEDFVFAWRVYSVPELGQSTSTPLNLIEEVAAPDARTVVFRWKALYPDAATLDDGNLQALPRHILERQFQEQPAEAFARLSFFTTDYLGLGPYRLSRWEAGAFLEATAFEGHAWGRPRIGRLRVLFISDFNTALATMLSGEAHITVDDAIRFQQAAILRREWAPREAGTVLTVPDQWRRTEIQHRPDFASPRAILDARVRRALAFAVDKEALNLGLFEGEAIMTDTFIPPGIGYYPAVDRAITKYPYDPRRSEQLMAEAGWTKGPDGTFAHPTEGRFSGEIKVNASSQAEAEMAIMGSVWRQAGFDFREVPVPPAQARLGEVRGSFPTLYTGGGSVGESALGSFVSSRVARPENNWVGGNRGGFVNPEYDRLHEAFNTTLDRGQRNQQVVEMARIFTDQVAAISLFFNPGIVAHVAALDGPRPFSPAADPAWAIHEWVWR